MLSPQTIRKLTIFIYADWLLKRAATTPAMPSSKPSIFMTWRCDLTRILRSLGARLSGAHALLYSNRGDTTVARRDAAKAALENAQKLQPNTPETLLFTGYYQYWVLHDY